MTLNQFTLERGRDQCSFTRPRKRLIKGWSEPRPGRMCNFSVVNLLTAKRFQERSLILCLVRPDA